MPRGRDRYCTISGTKEEIWEYMYGTEFYGNLPLHKKSQHVGHCWHQCPYSTECSDSRTRALLGLSDLDPLPAKVTHFNPANGKIHYLTTHSEGPRWGYECTFDDCPYYLSNNTRYFYV